MRRTPLLVLLVSLVVIAAIAAGLGVAAVDGAFGRASATGTGAAQASGSLTAAERAESDWPKPAAIDWHSCSAADLQQAGARCALVPVPLDWSHPHGSTIQLAISEVRSKAGAADYQGVMFTNPGGPGGSGLDLSTLGTAVPEGAGDDYDWIGFDPRGVGSSVPALSCDKHYSAGPKPAYDPDTAAIEQVWLAKTQGYAAVCGKAGGALLEHMTTADSARDMEYLRIALGATEMSYYGFSYGTELGQVYTTLFPSHLHRVVFDSTVYPDRGAYQGDIQQDIAFETTINAWFTWVAQHDSTYRLGTTRADVRARFDQDEAALADDPAGGVVGPDEWSDIFLDAGYYQVEWPDLAKAWQAWDARRSTGLLLEQYESTVEPDDDNGYAVYLAVQCTDSAWPSDWATWRADMRRTAAAHPYETWPNAWYDAPCRTWPAKASTPVKIDGSRTPSLLLIDETLDAATPYAGSVATRKLYPNSRLLAEPGGTSHAASLEGNSCVDDTVARYLATGALPDRASGDGPDATCAPSAPGQ